MELGENINDKDCYDELSEKKLEEIREEYPNFGELYTIEDKRKIEQLMQANESVSTICEVMGRKVDSVRKQVENMSKIKTSIKSYRQNI